MDRDEEEGSVGGEVCAHGTLAPVGATACQTKGGGGTPPAGEKASRLPFSSSFAALDSGWLSADESSGYESESAGGERAAAAAEGGSPGRQRRARTAFTSDQVCRLEKTFQRQKYLGASERRKLAAALQLSEIQVGSRGSKFRFRARQSCFGLPCAEQT